MSKMTDLTPEEEVLIALYRAYKRYKAQRPQRVSGRYLRRVDLNDVNDVSSDRLAMYIPKLISDEGWVTRTDGFDPSPSDSEVVLTGKGLEHARQVLARDSE